LRQKISQFPNFELFLDLENFYMEDFSSKWKLFGFLKTLWTNSYSIILCIYILYGQRNVVEAKLNILYQTFNLLKAKFNLH
jgi:hypothetical protein